VWRCIAVAGFEEQCDQLLELVEDEERSRALGGIREPATECFDGEDRARVVSLDEGRREVRWRAGLVQGNAFDDQLLAHPRLDPDALRPYPFALDGRYQPGVQQRRLAGPGIPVQKDAAVDDHEPVEQLRLAVTAEEDRLVDVPEWRQAAERRSREGDRRRMGRHGGISIPVTRL
jgi:hypothetical protein